MKKLTDRQIANRIAARKQAWGSCAKLAGRKTPLKGITDLWIYTVNDCGDPKLFTPATWKLVGRRCRWLIRTFQ